MIMETDEETMARLLPAALKAVLIEMIDAGEIRLVRKEQPAK